MDVRLMLGDCLERMQEIEAGSVDLIAADLPYGTTSCRWDAVIPFAPLWAAFRRTLKPRGAVVLTATQPFTSMLVTSNPGWFRYELIWEKSRPSGFTLCRQRPLKSHENVCVFSAGPSTYRPQMVPARRRVEGVSTVKAHPAVCQSDRVRSFDNGGEAYPRSVLRIANPNHANSHPTQKPVPLFEYLIRSYSDEGETVLDCCMGSGTTGVACVNTGRSFIGIERDPGYFRIAESRIASARSATPLFAGSA